MDGNPLRAGRRRRIRQLGAFAAALGLSVAACGPSGEGERAAEPVLLRLGYFPNVTHAPAILGLEQGLFAQQLGSGVSLETHTFNAGPEAVEALFSDALDISYIGPNPAINAFARSKGQAIRIIAGSTSGGAALVVEPRIRAPADLEGKKLASPQLGNTQDVALRSWLESQGLESTLSGGGDVSIVVQANAQTLEGFRAGEIQGAWVPEPWATRLRLEGGGAVLVDEASLWPDGRFVTTHVIVRTQFLSQRPDVVTRFLRGHVEAVDFASAHPEEAQAIVNQALEKLTGKALASETLQAAWQSLRFTVDPIASSLRKSAQDAQAVGLLEPVDLTGIYALGPLNALLGSQGKPLVSD